MKTPEQIASEVFGKITMPAMLAGGNIRDYMARAIEADRAQRQAEARNLYATDDIVDRTIAEIGIDWGVYEPNRDQVEAALDRAASLAIEAVDAHRAQHQDRSVYVIQSEEGDVIDVTTNREWAEWLTRDTDDNPARTLHEDTLWAGPKNKEDWA